MNRPTLTIRTRTADVDRRSLEQALSDALTGRNIDGEDRGGPNKTLDRISGHRRDTDTKLNGKNLRIST